MKYCHLVAALALAGCGLNTSALPHTGGSSDAGIHSADSLEDQFSVGLPAAWPTRRRPAQSVGDAGSGDTGDASSQPNRGGSSAERDAQTDPNDQASAEPGSASNPGQLPTSSGGSAQPGAGQPDAGQAPASGSSSHNAPSGSSTETGNGTPDPGSPVPEEPDAEEDPDRDDSADESGRGANGGKSSNGNGNGNGKDGNGKDGKGKDGNGNSGNGNDGNGNDDGNDNDTVSGIVQLVIALLEISLGPVRPAELEALVSSILVLSLAPADLAAESLVAVLDALEETQICLDHPERCNPLCTNLESDCSACGRDLDCIDRIEEMCKVRLPKTCL